MDESQENRSRTFLLAESEKVFRFIGLRTSSLIAIPISSAEEDSIRMPFLLCSTISLAPSLGVAITAHSQYIASRREVESPPPGSEEWI